MEKKEEGQARSLRDFYSVLFRHRSKAIVFFVLVIAAVVVGNTVAQKIYLSEAKLMVRIGRESVSLDPTVTTGQVVNVGQDRESEINSEIQILNSPELIERVVQALGVEQFSKDGVDSSDWLGEVAHQLKSGLKVILGPMLEEIKSLTRSQPNDSVPAEIREQSKIANIVLEHLNIEAIKKSNIIDISYEAPSPVLAQKVVNKLVELYLEKHINVYRTAGSYQFFKEQTKRLSQAIEATEEQIKDLKNKVGMVSLDDQRKVLFDRTGTLERTLGQTDFALAAARAKVADLKKRLTQLPKTVVTQQVVGFPDSAREELRKSINSLKLREQELLSTYTDQNVQVQEVRRQIREATALYAKNAEKTQVTQGVNSAYQQTELSLLTEEGNLASLEGQEDALKRQLAEARKEVKSLNDVEIQMAQLNRNLDTQKANFKKYSDSLEQTRIDQALDLEKISNISVVQPASYPLEPIRPKKAMNLLIGLVLGALGGIGLAFLAEYQDHSMKSPEDVERQLLLPVLATVPDWNSKQSRSALGPAAVERSFIDVFKHLQVPLGFGNQWDPLWDSLSDTGGKNARPLRSCVVTSWRPGEGVTTVATQLALTVVRREEGRVLLVDSNFMHSRLHTVLDCREGPGLGDMLATDSGRAGTIQPTRIPNLDFLACGSSEARTELHAKSIDADLLEPLLKRWYKEYRLVVFDAPPLGDESHTVRWAAAADGVVWVIEAEGVRLEVLQSGKERLRQDPARRLGVVLNKRKYHIPDWLYRTL